MISLIIFSLIPVMFHQQTSLNYIINIANGGLAILPATWIVIWQVRIENENKRKEDRRQKYDQLKITIYSLVASMNNFPQLFEPKVRISILDGTNIDYLKVIKLKDDIQFFKEEFHRESNLLKTQLIYLGDTEKEQENIFHIIKDIEEVEHYVQKLINILDESNLKGGLGYSERDYENIIVKMYDLKNIFCNLPNELGLNKNFLNLNTYSLDYYYYIIKLTKKRMSPIIETNHKITIAIFKDNLDKNISRNLEQKASRNYIANLDEAYRDCFKVFALRNDIRTGKQKYRYYKDTQNYGRLTIERLPVTMSKSEFIN